jgi:hypothetical protein
LLISIVALITTLLIEVVAWFVTYKMPNSCERIADVVF